MTSDVYNTALAELGLFSGREEKLRSITRYSLYHTVWYRTDLWTHTRRVAWIVEIINPIAKNIFGDLYDETKAVLLALVHDDVEILIGDIQAGNKSKMSTEELDKIKKSEFEAIDTLSQQFPESLLGYSYKELLLESAQKESLECMVLNWADKYDAFCEALHEIIAGNTLFTENVVNEYGTIPLPTEYYMNYFNLFSKKFPKSIDIYNEEDPWFTIPPTPDVFSYIRNPRVPNASSIQQKYGYEPYDRWVTLTLQRGTDEDVHNLYLQKEQ